ncbi:MAG: isochorismatase family protein [Planctomycetota bacterium]
MAFQYFFSTHQSNALCSEWLLFIRSRFRPRRSYSIAPEGSALIVVDMQIYFCKPEGRAFLPSATIALENVLTLAELFRSKNLPIFFTRHGHEGPSDTGMLGRFWSDFIHADEPQSALCPELKAAGESVIRKNTYDAFLGTDLHQRLQDCHVERLFFCGVMTNLCVETSARSSFCRGYEPHIIVDATATSSEELHKNSLLALASGFADLHTTSEIEEAWKLRF